MPDDLEGNHSWEVTDRGPYIRVHSGRIVFLADPRAEDFNLNDVSYHLAGLNRYTGASRYSVAQHCVVAAEMAARFYPEDALLPARMLIHDASEAFYGDMSSPLKSLIPRYKELENRAQLKVEEAFQLTFLGDPLVKEVDYRQWLTERENLESMGGASTNIDYSGPLKPFQLSELDAAHYYTEWKPRVAQEEWLIAFRRLFKWMQ